MGGSGRPAEGAHSGRTWVSGGADRTFGSTSVPGLPAKPVSDIVLVVTNSADESAYLPDLEAAGYILQFREPDWYEHRFLLDYDPDVQVRVFSVGSSDIERMLLFPDRLRSRSDERELYQRTKRDLAGQTGITSRTTPTPSRPSSIRSSPEHKLVRSTEPFGAATTASTGATHGPGQRDRACPAVLAVSGLAAGAVAGVQCSLWGIGRLRVPHRAGPVHTVIRRRTPGQGVWEGPVSCGR